MIKQQLGVDSVVKPGRTGQFDVVADSQTLVSRGGNWVTRKFGAGYPDFDAVIRLLRERMASRPAPG